MAEERIDGRDGKGLSSTRRFWRVNPKLRNTLPGRPTNFTSSPKYEDFRPRTIWSLSNAFTSAFKARR
jgi:hypothetical protein